MKHLITILALGCVFALSGCGGGGNGTTGGGGGTSNLPPPITAPTTAPSAVFVGHFVGPVTLKTTTTSSGGVQNLTGTMDLTVDANGIASGSYDVTNYDHRTISFGGIDGKGKIGIVVPSANNSLNLYGTVTQSPTNTNIIQGNYTLYNSVGSEGSGTFTLTRPAVIPGAYSITLLDSSSLGGKFNPAKINENGLIIGTLNASYSKPVLYNTGKTTLIQYDPGNPQFELLKGTGNDINDNNEVAIVFYNDLTTPRTAWAVKEKDGQFSFFNSNLASANGINNAGTVVGSVGSSLAKMWKKNASGNYEEIALAGLASYTYSAAYAVNSSEQIVGISAYAGRQRPQACIWQNGTVASLPNLAGGTYSGANAINDLGHAVGSCDGHAVIWKSGVALDLGGLPNDFSATAYSINDSDMVVGQSNQSPDSTSKAVLWKNSKIVDLNTQIDTETGWMLYSAQGINNKGQIVGMGNKGGFLLTPKS